MYTGRFGAESDTDVDQVSNTLKVKAREVPGEKIIESLVYPAGKFKYVVAIIEKEYRDEFEEVGLSVLRMVELLNRDDVPVEVFIGAMSKHAKS